LRYNNNKKLKMMKKINLIFLSLIMLIGINISAQNEDSAYMEVVKGRAAKIVKGMAMNDQARETEVTQLIAMHYFNLNKIYAKRDGGLKTIKDSGIKDTAALKRIEQAAVQSVDSLHPIFLASLGSYLTELQIAQVKDGLTYGVLPITYKGYCDMIPSLTQVQKDVIMKELVTAREKAMDAESSDRKHWWFGKYKGRINNYLAAEGYDTQKERAEWEKRMKAAGIKY